jgi:hypothetical protein
MIRLDKLTDYGLVLLTCIAQSRDVSLRSARDLAAESGLPQYCSLKNVNAFPDVETLAWHLVSWPQWVFAHLALHATRIPSFAAGDHAFFEYFVKNRVVQVFSRPRGE